MTKSDIQMLIESFGGKGTKFAKAINAEILTLKNNGTYRDVPVPALLAYDSLKQWVTIRRGAVPPAEYVIPIVAACEKYGIRLRSGEVVTNNALRPDLYPHPLSDSVAA